MKINYKIFALGFIAFLFLTNCNKKLKNVNSESKSISLWNKEFLHLYKKNDSIVEIARVIQSGKENFKLQFSKINILTPEYAKQHFISELDLSKKELENKKLELQKTYNWKPVQGNDILFIQIQPSKFKNELQMLDRRQEIEEKINQALQNNNCGEWFAGDLGPGGGNMLYTVNDIEKSLPIILEVLQQNKLEKNVLIGKRILTEKDEWFYEVIYPNKYSGNFNTM